MFNTPRYATQGVSSEISSDLQNILWHLIDEQQRKGQELDYLQIFELSIEYVKGEIYQKIIHRQEVTSSANQHIIRLNSQLVTGKVWVIANTEYTTMLLPEEY